MLATTVHMAVTQVAKAGCKAAHVAVGVAAASRDPGGSGVVGGVWMGVYQGIKA
jgi:hypothetical protein